MTIKKISWSLAASLTIALSSYGVIKGIDRGSKETDLKLDLDLLGTTSDTYKIKNSKIVYETITYQKRYNDEIFRDQKIRVEYFSKNNVIHYTIDDKKHGEIGQTKIYKNDKVVGFIGKQQSKNRYDSLKSIIMEIEMEKSKRLIENPNSDGSKELMKFIEKFNKEYKEGQQELKEFYKASQDFANNIGKLKRD